MEPGNDLGRRAVPKEVWLDGHVHLHQHWSPGLDHVQDIHGNLSYGFHGLSKGPFADNIGRFICIMYRI